MKTLVKRMKGRLLRLSKHSSKEQELESLIETLIKMLGKSNERVNDLNKRVTQLEMLIRESVLRDYRMIDVQPQRNMKIS